MKTVKRIVVFVMLCGIIYFSGCAAGSATAGYSLRAATADELSPKAEWELTERIMQKVKQWHESQSGENKD